jgi:hydrogenase maturation protein HypF
VYEFTFREDEILVKSIIEGILTDKENKVPFPEIAARFHNTVAEIIIKGIARVAKETGLEKVVLSGGTFQNMYLTGRVISELKNKGFQVYINQKVPCNDGGLALGQMAVAMKKHSMNN